jgi:hypothetical protein
MFEMFGGRRMSAYRRFFSRVVKDRLRRERLKQEEEE